MLQHVWERACLAGSLGSVIVATDDERIARAARLFGANVEMTRADHPSGTDRAAEVASRAGAEIVVNIQGDEPLIDPEAVDLAVEGLLSSNAPMATLKKLIEDAETLANPNVVKVVTDLAGDAVYFSRWPVPYVRAGAARHYKHIGLYAYRRGFLLIYSGLPAGPLEEAEKLEQLRALENGYKIRVVETSYDSLGVDTPEDLERVRELVESKLAAR
jgi:3-deoxy-manno-octulosonate cytidylyltransferase (CMP-KDO synthetase)